MDRTKPLVSGDVAERGSVLVEEALELIYRGQCNVAKKAKEIGVTTEELKRLFRDYAVKRPIDEDVWRGDVELGWPWV